VVEYREDIDFFLLGSWQARPNKTDRSEFEQKRIFPVGRRQDLAEHFSGRYSTKLIPYY
jgi:hypothetical protein